jgi:thiol-disulfide isomerase/thioredoxin
MSKSNSTTHRGRTGKGGGAQGRQAAARRRRPARLALVAGCVAAVVAVGFLAFQGSSSGSSVTTTAAFSLPALNGPGKVALADFRGKPTVVNFFASWCSACDRELPGFKAEADALKGKVTFIGVDSLETGDKNFMPDRHHLKGSFAALAQDVAGANGSGLHDALGGGNSMPLTAFYGADGTLLSVQRTALEPQVLHDQLVTLYHLPA